MGPGWFALGGDAGKAASAVEEEYAVKEILQETALYALWRADFFDVAAFQGGTLMSMRLGCHVP
jgi:predicted nucleotidyltransferase component of viral defense system